MSIDQGVVQSAPQEAEPNLNAKVSHWRAYAAYLAIGVAALGAYEAYNLYLNANDKTPEVAAPHPDIADNPEATTTTVEALPVRIEVPAVPEDVSDFLSRNTILAEGRCSGSLIRDPSGTAIGYSTARHCWDSADQEVDAVGMLHMNVPPVEVTTGDAKDQLHVAGNVDSFLMPRSTTTHEVDNALGVFEGVDPDAVLEAYEASNLPIDQVRDLRLGDQVFLSGWPADQDNNTSGVMRRQTFGTTVIGSEFIDAKDGRQVRILWTALESSDDGAECSHGMSGARAFVRREVQNPDGTVSIKILGVGTHKQSYDLTGDVDGTPEEGARTRRDFEDRFGVVLPANITRVCAIAVDRATADNTDVVYTNSVQPSAPTTSSTSVPLPSTTETTMPPTTSTPPTTEIFTPPTTEAPTPPETIPDIERARDEAAVANAEGNFWSPNAQHLALEGWAQISTGSKTGDYEYVENPYMFVDVHNSRVVFAQEGPGKDLVQFFVVRDGDSSHVQFFDKTGTMPGIDTLELGTSLDVSFDEAGQPYALTDETGLLFGRPQAEQPAGIDPAAAYEVHIVGGEPIFLLVEPPAGVLNPPETEADPASNQLAKQPSY